MRFDRAFAQHQSCGNLAVRPALPNQHRNFALAPGQSIRCFLNPRWSSWFEDEILGIVYGLFKRQGTPNRLLRLEFGLWEPETAMLGQAEHTLRLGARNYPG